MISKEGGLICVVQDTVLCASLLASVGASGALGWGRSGAGSMVCHHITDLGHHPDQPLPALFGLAGLAPFWTAVMAVVTAY